ncbi:hypothetical protein HW555_012940 [Spodoptera exigua]|uniref:Uncharacterized protein n=1 Tax=Spodoptera exigua TaxID=7107 RepID=A0A835KXG5_SPOEX|nr:hypothetical protein HW555_012940 [Spodoptera exigua]
MSKVDAKPIDIPKQMDAESYHQYIGLSIQFKFIGYLFKVRDQGQSKVMVSVFFMLVRMTRLYLATGCSFGDFELVYRCGASTARLIESDPWTSCTCIQYAAYNKTRPGRRDWGAARRGGKKPATVAVYAHESNDKTQPQVASALDSRSLWLGRGHSSAQCAPILYKMYEETRPQVVAATSG